MSRDLLTSVAPRNEFGVPRMALRLDEAAESLGVSRDWFDDHVRPEIEVVGRGRMTLVPLTEIGEWLGREKTGVDF